MKNATTHTARISFYGQTVRLTVSVKGGSAIKYGVIGIQEMVDTLYALEAEHGAAFNANWATITRSMNYDPRPIR